MNHSALLYSRRVNRHLQCSPNGKIRLLESFTPNLEMYLEEHPDASYNDFCEAFGPPADMAATLLLEATSQEKQTYRRGRLLLRITAGALCAMLLLFSAYVFFIKEFRVSFHDVYYIYEIETVPG